ncbi:MAG: hypothetical protein E6J58_24190 [Deltaproteobacteria bacterium]|nr:MAG: hypothetical protein E6J58_24190 [Deltaproteobacteria bacterium]
MATAASCSDGISSARSTIARYSSISARSTLRTSDGPKGSTAVPRSRRSARSSESAGRAQRPNRSFRFMPSARRNGGWRCQ